MSITTIYKDKNGNEHATKAGAKKVNRLIESCKSIVGYDPRRIAASLAAGGTDDAGGSETIEFARAVVAIYGMKDKAPKTEGAK